MKAEAKSLHFLGECKKLTVPFFQRHYVWKEENWKEMLQTFENTEATPFLGSIILKHAENGFTSEAVIIDGQQRLTTISIFEKAIYDCLPDDAKKKSGGIRRGIEAYLFYTINASDDFDASHVKIEHSRLDREDYNHVMKSGLAEGVNLINCDEISESSSKILQCYKYFHDKLISKTPDELKKLHDSIFNDCRLTVVLIELNSNDINEQRIFDTINRAGIKLSSADIIKNNLFKQCLDTCAAANKTRDDVCSIHDTLWEATFYRDEEISQLWDIKRIFGNVQKSNIEFLLYCVAEIKWGKDSDLFSNLEKVYLENTANYSYDDMEDLIDEISKYGCLYKKYIIDFHDRYINEEEPLVFGYKDTVNRLLLFLDVFGIQMFYPYVLKRIRDANENFNDESLCHDFAVLESFIIRRRLSGKGVTDYAIKCDQILHLSIGNDILNVLAKEMGNASSDVCDDAIANYFDKVNNETAKPILFIFELYKRNQPKHDNSKVQYSFTLEHIIPKRWKKYWNDVKIYDMESGKVLKCSEEDRDKYRDRAVMNLGNMILLNQPLNSSVSNNKIEVKINGNKEKQYVGYRSCSSMELTREVVATYDRTKKWDERDVASRKKDLLELFFKIWPNYSNEIEQEADGSDMMADIDVVSQEALMDPIVMLKEMGSCNENPFLAQIRNMIMQYSYKPVFMKSLLDCANQNGESKLEDVVEYFIKFYKALMDRGLKEKDDSAFAKKDCSYNEAKNTILTYPCDIFEREGYVEYIKEEGLIKFNVRIWSSLSKKDKEKLHKICDGRIEKYFENN